MRASETTLLEFIRRSPQFLIPVTQRRYAWTQRECRQLWNDILEAGESAGIREHFLGSVIYVAAGEAHVTQWSPLLVYDGQQRLTTVSLILEALARHLEGEDAPDGFEPGEIRNGYLLNGHCKGERHYRLVLKPGDAETLLALVHLRPLPLPPSPLILDAFELFRKLVARLGPDVSALCAGLCKLRIVDIALKEGEDNPQRIFETMNACGRALGCADLIGNYILMPLDREQQKRLHEDHLQPIESGFARHPGDGHFEAFIRHFLTLKTGEVSRKGREYAVFKDHARSCGMPEAGPEALASELRVRAGHYRAFALGEETDLDLARAFDELRRLRAEPALPFLLRLYADHAEGQLCREDFVAIVRLVTAYVLRRAVCGLKPSAPGTVFAGACRTVEPERYAESARAWFLTLPGGLAFPDDDAFRAALMNRNLYNFRHCDYVLERLENHGRREAVPLDDLTVDHIMPQSERLPDEWKAELGPDWAGVWQTWRHTLGNLTLTAFNGEMGNRPFRDKRDGSRGYRDSPLFLNEDLRRTERWDADAIRTRGSRLAGRALEIWPRPSLPESVLAAYPCRRPGAGAYALGDHPPLRPGATMHGLFQSFRDAVLVLHPSVREEVKRHYVAYKARTNFVDLVAQKRRLLLMLNMRFGDLIDPRGVAVDVTGRGLWGNGEVKVELEHERQLPYVMDLVRQAFERKHGGSGPRV